MTDWNPCPPGFEPGGRGLFKKKSFCQKGIFPWIVSPLKTTDGCMQDK